MRSHKILLVLVLWLVLALSGCKDDELLFPVEPQLEFISVEPTVVREAQSFEDSIPLVIKVRYTDGDGDLGTEDPQPNQFNFVMEDQREGLPLTDVVIRNDTLDNGDIVQVADTVVLYDGKLQYVLPDLTPDARKPSIQGEIRLTINAGLRRLDPTASEDSVRFKIYVFDRAGNKSNEILTDYIRILPPN